MSAIYTYQEQVFHKVKKEKVGIFEISVLASNEEDAIEKIKIYTNKPIENLTLMRVRDEMIDVQKSQIIQTVDMDMKEGEHDGH